MKPHYQPIDELVSRVRARWRTLAMFQAAMRAALASGAVLLVALIVTHWTGRAPIALAVTGIVALVVAMVGFIWGFSSLRHVPSDVRVARFIEERAPSLDDRLVTAVDVVTSGRDARSPNLAEPMLADASARARAVDLETIVTSEALRRAGFQALAAVGLLLMVLVLVREPARLAYDAASLSLFPHRISLEVRPGNARVKAGSALAIEATLVGSQAPVLPRVEIGDGDSWHAAEMTKDAASRFRLALESVTLPFKYRVVAGPLTSPSYAIAVARPPRVARIDVDYVYPAALRLKPRTEEDSGDIYAPAGTDVRLHIHADRPAATGQITLADGNAVQLSVDAPDRLSTALKVIEDNSYRVALVDSEGLSSAGDTEYFIRVLEDRSPEVHIVKPASDRAVTRLEEIDIEVQADDDYGIDRLDLVYAVRGGDEKVVPFDIPRRAPSVTGRRTLYLEDLDVQPGDFVSYYARARDITRGKRSNEARSDIFFLEVKPFEQEFALAQSQSMAGSGYSGSIDDLVNMQKQVVVATWKLDRRSRSAKGAQSEQDIRSVSRTEAELKSRVEQTSSTFRESTMRDPRNRQPQRGRGGAPPPPDAPKAGQTMPEEDSMAAAAAAMGRAITALNALKTGDALPSEMEALNDLLKAQAEVKRRQVMRQQAGAGGPGNNNRNYDISTLFDRELQRAQQTNYETPATSAQKDAPNAGTLDKIRDLARRQDELLKRQQDLTRDRDKLSEEELKRRLEKLTRDQMELRQRVEELARQMSGWQSSGQTAQQASQSGQPTKDPQSTRGGGGSAADRMREVSEEMRNAAGNLRRQDPGQASARSGRALEKPREVERQVQPLRPDERRRALGEMQLETRQLADAQRQVASELARAGQGEAASDTMRRLAGEEGRLAERTKRLQEGLKQASAGDASREIEQQRLAERMQRSADEMRSAAQPEGADKERRPLSSKGADNRTSAQASAQQEIARTLERLADKLASAVGSKDGESRKLSDEIARTHELRDRMNTLSRQMEQIGRQSPNNTGRSSALKTPGDAGRSGQGQGGGEAAGGADLARLREEYARQLKETEELLDRLRRDDPTFARGGAGFTFEGQGMTMSAPGTEDFKQDFAKWEELRRQATTALDRAESSLSNKLNAERSKDRLAAGVEDKAPPEYQKQVDTYFRAIAAKKKP